MNSAFTQIFVWGDDQYGQLGLGSDQIAENYPSPKQCSFNVLIRQISCGDEFSAILTSDGTLFTIGSNAAGRLGLNNKKIHSSQSPCLVDSIRVPIDQISWGWGHAAALTEAGEVFTWGLGDFGALGGRTTKTQWAPQLVTGLSRVAIEKISCGSRHTTVISHKNKAYIWGTVIKRELINITKIPIDNIQDIDAGQGLTIMSDHNGHVYTIIPTKKSPKVSSVTPNLVSTLKRHKITQVACGSYFGAISKRGDMFLWNPGQNPMQARVNKVMQVSFGGDFAVALTSQGQTYSWGSNSNGELGISSNSDKSHPVLVTLPNAVSQVAAGYNFVMAAGLDVEAKFEEPEIINEQPPVQATQVQENTQRTDYMLTESVRQLASPMQLQDLDPSTLTFDFDDWILDIRHELARLNVPDRTYIDSKLNRLQFKHAEYRNFYNKEISDYKARIEELENAARLQVEATNKTVDNIKREMHDKEYTSESIKIQYERKLQEMTKKVEELRSQHTNFKASHQGTLEHYRHILGETGKGASQLAEQLNTDTENIDPSIDVTGVNYYMSMMKNLESRASKISEDNEVLKTNMETVEMRNKELNDMVQRSILEKAHSYRTRTLSVLDQHRSRSSTPNLECLSMPHITFDHDLDDLPTAMPTCTSGQETYRTTAGVTPESNREFVKEF